MSVAWTDAVRFVRQLNHDLRNHLNAVELQSAFLAELATDAELKEEITRLRQMVSQCGGMLQKLSARLNPPAPNVTLYNATDLVEDLRTKTASEFPKETGAIRWELQLGDAAQVMVDPQLLQEALLELVRNALENQVPGSSLHFLAKTEGDNLVLTLYEPKTAFELPTDNWGREPLRSANRGHYGLGLNRARIIIENQGGQLRAKYDPKESKLITTVVLPVSDTN